jgi:hypothetical protein
MAESAEAGNSFRNELLREILEGVVTGKHR